MTSQYGRVILSMITERPDFVTFDEFDVVCIDVQGADVRRVEMDHKQCTSERRLACRRLDRQSVERQCDFEFTINNLEANKLINRQHSDQE